MNFAQLIFGQVAFIVNFYADQFRELDQAGLVSAPDFATNFNLPLSEEPFDFIIVGGGTAGCLVANRLANAHGSDGSPFRVLLLESGGDQPSPTAIPGNAVHWSGYDQIKFERTSTPQWFPHGNVTRTYAANTGRVLGGTSVLNYMFFNRGSPHDFDNWANITGDPSWSYANLLRHFRATETYAGDHPDGVEHGSEGELPISTQTFAPGAARFLAAGAELGYPADVDPNGPQRVGFTRIDVNRRMGRRFSSYAAFLAGQIVDLPNLEIRRYAHVQEIIFEKEGGASGALKAAGVAYTRHGFPFISYATREIVVSAGTHGSAEILLRSGVGPPEELQAVGVTAVLDLPVGRNFQDHPILALQFHVRDSSEVFSPALNITTDSVREFLDEGRGPLTSVEGLAAQAFIASSHAQGKGHPEWPDLQLTLYSKDREALPLPPGADPHTIVYAYLYLGRPKSTGSVRLNPDATAAEALLIDFNMLAEEEDMQMYLEGIRLVLNLFENTTSYREYGATYPEFPLEECAHHAFRSDEYWRCYVSHVVRPGNHPSSTCSMGRVGDPKAVVDSKLRVIGAKGMRVIDASVMPVITNANIQAAVYVIAEKGAADIVAEHGGNPGNGAPRQWVTGGSVKFYLVSVVALVVMAKA